MYIHPTDLTIGNTFQMGEEVLQVAEKADVMINDMAGRIRGGSTSLDGEIRITMVAPLAGLIMKSVAAFRRQHPNCSVCIIASEDLARLEYGEAHIALRVGAKPDHPDYVVRLFEQVRFNLYAHDSYLSRYGVPESIDNMEGHEFVVPPLKENRLPFLPWIRKHVKPAQFAVTSNHLWVNLQAFSEGLGMGFLSDHDVAGRNDLHPVLPGNDAWILTIWQVTHVDLHRSEKVQALLSNFNAALETRD